MYRSMILNRPHFAYIGEIHFEDKSKPGEITKLVAGDVLHIDQGMSYIITTPKYAKGR